MSNNKTTVSNPFDDDESNRDKEIRKKLFEDARKDIPQKGFFSLATEGKQFPEHMLFQHDIFLNGKFTGRRITEYKGQYCATTTPHYNLIPNEEIVKLADKVLVNNTRWNLLPNTSTIGGRNGVPQGRWYVQNGNVLESTPTKYVAGGASMLARYSFPEKIDPTGDGRELTLGIAISNSIDLSRGFAVYPMHDRAGCINSMVHVRMSTVTKEGDLQWSKVGTSDGQFGSYGGDGNTPLDQAIKNVITEGDNLQSTARDMKTVQRGVRHTRLLDEEFMTHQIELAVEKVLNLADAYKVLSQLKISTFIANKIANSRLPIRVKNGIEGFKWEPVLDKNDNPVMEFGKPKFSGEIVEIEDKTENNWQIYNQVTDALSHGGLQFNSTLNHMGELDSIFMTQPEVIKVMVK